MELSVIEPEAEPVDELPYSQPAEQALLGAMLYDNETYFQVSPIVRPEHFYNPVHSRIYDAISGLVESGKLADAIVLKNRFSKDETLVDIGGAEYLAMLLQHAPHASAAKEYAALVFDLAVRRELIRFSDETKELASDPESDEDALRQVEQVEEKLYTLSQTGVRSRGFETFGQSIVEAINAATAAYERKGELSGISTGLIDLDRLLGGLHDSDLIILAGRPSMGKTALATNIAFDVAKNYVPDKDNPRKAKRGGRVGFFSLEMSKSQLATRILAEQSGVPSHKIRRGQIDASEYERIRDSANEISTIPLYIDDMGGQSIGAVSARARRLKRMHGLDLIVVDYLQLLNGGRKVKSNDGRVQEVSIITQDLKALAKELQVPVLALAQLSRAVEQRDDKRPQLSDLRESGSIEQDADVVAFVYREEYYLKRTEPDEGSADYAEWLLKYEAAQGRAEVIIGKQRHGPIDTVNLAFNPSLTKFGNLADHLRHGGG